MNKIYYISYDSVDNLEKVETTIKSIGAWFKYFDNQWLLDTTKSKKEIYDLIQNESNPYRILILEVEIINFWGWMPETAWEWINKRISMNKN